jgi:hypothetical protein
MGSMERAVARGRRPREWEGLCHLGLDEKSFGRGQSSISLLTDRKGSRVLEVTPDNDRAAADQLLASLPEPVRSDNHRGTTWGAMGETPVVKDSGDRFGVKIVSAVSPRGDMRFAVIEGKMNSDKFIASSRSSRPMQASRSSSLLIMQVTTSPARFRPLPKRVRRRSTLVTFQSMLPS